MTSPKSPSPPPPPPPRPTSSSSPSVTEILREMTEELLPPLSPLHDSLLLPSPPPSPRPTTSSLSATEILREMTEFPPPLSPLDDSLLLLSPPPPPSSATKITSTSSRHWSEEEKRLVLQGLGECGNDWELLSKYVKSKSPDQIRDYVKKNGLWL